VDLADFPDWVGGETAAMMGVSCDPETAIIPCDDDDWPSPPPAPRDTTRLDYFMIYFGDGIGDAEIEYRAKYYDASGVLLGSRT
jgi:hypothetical protein